MAFAVICLVVSNVFENIGVATGFPFGPYHYTDVLGPKLGYVPLMIGPAYLGVGYLSWVLATVLVGDVKRGADAFQTFRHAADRRLHHGAVGPGDGSDRHRRVGQWWIWEQGGGFFGVPLENYLGWYLTVFAFMQLFALYLRARGPEQPAPQPRGYYLQAAAMYAVVGLDFVMTYLMKSGGENVVDAAGVTWRTGRHLRDRSPHHPADDDVRRRARHGDDPSVQPDDDALVGAFEQAAGDHLRLDLGGALEDVEDARVAQHAADRDTRARSRCRRGSAARCRRWPRRRGRRAAWPCRPRDRSGGPGPSRARRNR